MSNDVIYWPDLPDCYPRSWTCPVGVARVVSERYSGRHALVRQVQDEIAAVFKQIEWQKHRTTETDAEWMFRVMPATYRFYYGDRTP